MKFIICTLALLFVAMAMAARELIIVIYTDTLSAKQNSPNFIFPKFSAGSSSGEAGSGSGEVNLSPRDMAEVLEMASLFLDRAAKRLAEAANRNGEAEDRCVQNRINCSSSITKHTWVSG